MELLIFVSREIMKGGDSNLNSNMELLISFSTFVLSTVTLIFKFQYGATNIFISGNALLLSI